MCKEILLTEEAVLRAAVDFFLLGVVGGWVGISQIIVFPIMSSSNDKKVLSASDCGVLVFQVFVCTWHLL